MKTILGMWGATLGVVVLLGTGYDPLSVAAIFLIGLGSAFIVIG